MLEKVLVRRLKEDLREIVGGLPKRPILAAVSLAEVQRRVFREVLHHQVQEEAARKDQLLALVLCIHQLSFERSPEAYFFFAD
jgi:hypothetical protein